MLNYPNLAIDRLEKDIGQYFMADRYFSIKLGSVTYHRAMFHGKVLGWVTPKYNYLPFVIGEKEWFHLTQQIMNNDFLYSLNLVAVLNAPKKVHVMSSYTKYI